MGILSIIFGGAAGRGAAGLIVDNVDNMENLPTARVIGRSGEEDIHIA